MARILNDILFVIILFILSIILFIYFIYHFIFFTYLFQSTVVIDYTLTTDNS